MRLIFIDETDRQANATKRTFFCICGLIIDDTEIIDTLRELEKIKQQHGLINLKESRKNGLDEETRISITKKVYDCLKEHKVEIISIILGDFSMSFSLPKDDMYMGAMSFLMERFTLSLKKSNTNGAVIFDCLEKSLENSLRKKFYQYVQEGVIQMFWENKPRAIIRDYVQPTIFFTDDGQSLLIQSVDLIATSLNSSIVNTAKLGAPIDIESLETGNKFLKIYWPLFTKSPKGKISGWGIKIWD